MRPQTSSKQQVHQGAGMSFFQSRDYRTVLSERIRDWKSHASQRTLSRLADAIGVQVSYLSNSLKGRAHLSSDQVYAICNELGCSAIETEYALLLLERERSSHSKRREELDAKIEAIQRDELSTVKSLKAKPPELSAWNLERYYLDPFVQLIHIYIRMTGPISAAQLTLDFGLTPEHTGKVLETLESIGDVTRTKDRFVSINPGRHLPKKSPVAGPHLLLMRIKSLDQLQRLTDDEKYSFSATIATTRETRDQLELLFIEFLKKAEALVGSAESESLYQINFDLFPWITRQSSSKK